MSGVLLRPAGFDELGLRRALSDRMLPLLVAAMAFLAALSLAGWFGAAALTDQWREGVGSALTVQVPDPNAVAASGETRLHDVLAVLVGTPGIASARALTNEDLTRLLRPWLGSGADKVALPLPGVVAVRLSGASGLDPAPLAARLESAAPGTMMEDHGIWVRRLSVLARSLQACSLLAVVLVAAVAAAVIAVATRAGLAARRQAIEIVHGLGATDGYIAGRFAARATLLAAVGGLAGAIAAMPVLILLADLAAPFSGRPPAAGSVADMIISLPAPLWLALPALPIGAAAIGFLTAQGTVRRWLRRLP